MNNLYNIGDTVRIKTVSQIKKIPNKHLPAYIWKSDRLNSLEDMINYNRDYIVENVTFDKNTGKYWYNLYIPNPKNNLQVTAECITKVIGRFNHTIYDTLIDKIKKSANHLYFDLYVPGKNEWIRTGLSVPIRSLKPKAVMLFISGASYKPVMVYTFEYVSKLTKETYTYELEYVELMNLATQGFTRSSLPNQPIEGKTYKINNFKLI